MISVARFRRILAEEARRSLSEAAADEEDFISRAYTGGADDSGSMDAEPASSADSDSPGSEDDDRSDVESAEPEDAPDDLELDEPVDSEESSESSDDDETSTPEAEQVKQSLLSKFNNSKVVDFGLDILGTASGFIADAATAGTMGLGAGPAYVLAAMPDLLNCERHAARGEKLSAAIYFLCALPVIGDVLGPVKIAIKALGSASEAVEIYKIIMNIRRLTKALKVTRAFMNGYATIKKLMLKHFPDDNVKSSIDISDKILNGSTKDVVKVMKDEGYDVSTLPRPSGSRSKAGKEAAKPAKELSESFEISERQLRRIIALEIRRN